MVKTVVFIDKELKPPFICSHLLLCQNDALIRPNPVNYPTYPPESLPPGVVPANARPEIPLNPCLPAIRSVSS